MLDLIIVYLFYRSAADLVQLEALLVVGQRS